MLEQFMLQNAQNMAGDTKKLFIAECTNNPDDKDWDMHVYSTHEKYTRKHKDDSSNENLMRTTVHETSHALATLRFPEDHFLEYISTIPSLSDNNNEEFGYCFNSTRTTENIDKQKHIINLSKIIISGIIGQHICGLPQDISQRKDLYKGEKLTKYDDIAQLVYHEPGAENDGTALKQTLNILAQDDEIDQRCMLMHLYNEQYDFLMQHRAKLMTFGRKHPTPKIIPGSVIREHFGFPEPSLFMDEASAHQPEQQNKKLQIKPSSKKERQDASNSN